MGFLIPLIIGAVATASLIGEVDTKAPIDPSPRADDEQWGLDWGLDDLGETLEKGMTTIQLVAVAVILANTVGVLK